MKIAYFDHSATTPLDPLVLSEMIPYFSESFGNPSSLHSLGRQALEAVDIARGKCGAFLNCQADEVVFTSGATEADNLAVMGVIRAAKRLGVLTPHVVTIKIEHDAILEPLNFLKSDGVEVDFIDVQVNGVVDVEDIKVAIKPNTVLVTVMQVNSEVGSVQPIKEIGRIVKNVRNKRKKEWDNSSPSNRESLPTPIFFHSDATQATNFLDCDVARNNLDLLSLSGHKVYGPKGVGLLYVRKGVPLVPTQLGGHHEKNRRSGTLNVASIIGLGAALNLAKIGREDNNDKITKLRNRLVNGVMSNIPKSVLNTDLDNSVASHAHFSFLGVEGESMLLSLDFEGIAVSTGSACASGSLKPSHVLMAMGIKQEVCHNSVRFTLGKSNTEEDVDRVIKVLPPIIERLRKMSPEKNY
jgi:cysteine desulfurase